MLHSPSSFEPLFALALSALALVATTGCRTPTQADAEPTQRSLERRAGDCDFDPPDRVASCARYVATWPDFGARTEDPDARTGLEEAVEQMLVASQIGDTTRDTVAEQADDFVASWRSASRRAAESQAAGSETAEPFDSPGADPPGIHAAARRSIGDWSVEKSVTVVFDSDRALSLELTETTDLGGAHPNQFCSLQSLDPRTGRAYTLDDLFLDGWGRPLLDRAEQAFRRHHELPATGSLNAHGFFFPTDSFELPQNWAVGRKGLLLHYNAYEVAPYVMGETRLTLPWTDLADLVDPRGPIDSPPLRPAP